jgi:TonB family protein
MSEVSDVLRDRRLQAGGLQQMAAVSALVHAGLLALIVLAPARWLTAPPDAAPTVMTISLNSGTPGPTSGGMTQIGGRAIQAETPPDAPKRPEAVRAPAAVAPTMTVPVPERTPTRRGSAEVKQAPTEARGTTPTRGAQVTEGTSLAETGARGRGFGLSSGGGGGSGIQLDVGDFCCPDYLMQMVQRIRSNWNPQAEVAGQAIVRFTIQRDGTLTAIEVVEASRYAAHNLLAQRALVVTRQLPPLPAGYPNPALTMRITFEYTR